LAFPEWTEAYTNEQDSIQFLRLNELRDSINELLFPYLITITPYFRMVSWLTWIFTTLEKDVQKQNAARMTARDYVNNALRYYGIFAVADILFSKADGTYHRGPIGVRDLTNKLALLGGDTVNFSNPSFGKPQDPTPNYRSSLVAMNLLEEKLQPISSGRFQSILIPTESGKKLAKAFESKWSVLVDPKELTSKTKWNTDLLQKLGKLVNLQGLSLNDEESMLLQNAARSSMRYHDFYNNFVDISLKTVKEGDRAGFKLFSSDVAKAALYRVIPAPEEREISIKLKDTQATTLLAYHELHTHMSFGADAILDGLVNLARNNFTGISKKVIITKASTFMETEITKPGAPIEDFYEKTKKSFNSFSGKYQTGCPAPFGKFGFETARVKIEDSEDYFEKIAYGAMILLQSAVCQEFFKPDLLIKILPYHRKVFSAYTILEEYQSLPPKGQAKQWVEAVVDLIIQRHDDVADSKGLYAKRFENREGRLFYRADADFGEQRGRLANAVLWLSDIGVLGVDQGLFTVSR
jgi:hypothetical protein